MQAYEQIFQFKSNIDLQEQKKSASKRLCVKTFQILSENRDNSVQSVTLIGRGNFHKCKIKTLNDLIRYIKNSGLQK